MLGLPGSGAVEVFGCFWVLPVYRVAGSLVRNISNQRPVNHMLVCYESIVLVAPWQCRATLRARI